MILTKDAQRLGHENNALGLRIAYIRLFVKEKQCILMEGFSSRSNHGVGNGSSAEQRALSSTNRLNKDSTSFEIGHIESKGTSIA